MIKNKSNFDRKEQKVLRFFFSIAFEKGTIFRKCAQNYPEHYPTKQKKFHHSYLANIWMRNEGRFMYKINQGHLTVFCIVFVWLGGPPSPVKIMTQVPWFMYQNGLWPSGGIYYPNFVPCFVVLYLNFGRFGNCILLSGKKTYLYQKYVCQKILRHFILPLKSIGKLKCDLRNNFTPLSSLFPRNARLSLNLQILICQLGTWCNK